MVGPAEPVCSAKRRSLEIFMPEQRVQPTLSAALCCIPQGKLSTCPWVSPKSHNGLIQTCTSNITGTSLSRFVQADQAWKEVRIYCTLAPPVLPPPRPNLPIPPYCFSIPPLPTLLPPLCQIHLIWWVSLPSHLCICYHKTLSWNTWWHFCGSACQWNTHSTGAAQDHIRLSRILEI